MKNHTRGTSVFMKIVAVPLIAVAVGGCSAGAAEPPSRPGEQVEVLELEVDNDQYAAVDLGATGISLGDMDVFSGNAIKDGRAVGRGGGTCQITHIDGAEIARQCMLTMELEHGSVTMQSLWVGGASPLDMAVTGGTGTYRNARGTVRFWDIATPSERARAEIVY
jgi:hypothetical protein